MQLIAGIDLPSSNNYIGIIDEHDNKVFGKRVENHLPYALKAMEPYQKDLKAVVVKSTYNWYWLMDGLQEQGYRVHLANPSAIQTYDTSAFIKMA